MIDMHVYKLILFIWIVIVLNVYMLIYVKVSIMLNFLSD